MADFENISFEQNLSENEDFITAKQPSDLLSNLSIQSAAKDESDIVYAIYDYECVGNDQLSFRKGDVLKILDRNSEHWWWAELNGQVGYVPASYFTTDYLQQMYWQDEEYFGSYGKLKLHQEMLSDRPRTLAFEHAIRANAHLLKDKVILDVGCGTGILSMMCAKYGQPKQVYAVEASDMALYTSKIMLSNGLSDIVTVLHNYVEEIQLDRTVDLIVSEWMGTLLLFEMMIESVLIARNKFLKPDGKLWPSSASLFLVPVSAETQHRDLVDFWSEQYGFDFSCLKSLAIQECFQKPNHCYVLKREDCLAAEIKLMQLDLATLRIEDLEEISCSFQFQIMKSGVLHGFCTWFQVDFKGLAPDVPTSFLNTGPDHGLTHWKQNLFLFDEGLDVLVGDSVRGTATICRHSDWRRHLRFVISFAHVQRESGQLSEHKKIFYIWR